MPDLFKEILPDINYGKKNLIRTGDMDEGELVENLSSLIVPYL